MKKRHSVPVRAVAGVVVTAFLAAALPLKAYAGMIGTDTVVQQWAISGMRTRRFPELGPT